MSQKKLTADFFMFNRWVNKAGKEIKVTGATLENCKECKRFLRVNTVIFNDSAGIKTELEAQNFLLIYDLKK